MINRKRAVVHNLLAYAVERGMLAVNPMSQSELEASETR